MKRRLLFNTALLTAASLLMSGIAMLFRAWLAGRIGTAGIGLYQLVMSVMNLGATFAISGIRFAATRLVAEELGLSRQGSIRAAMGRCLAYGLFFGTAAAVILWELADTVGVRWIGDARTVRSLRLASLSMPCISLSAALTGYFTACGRIWKPTLIHLTEQLCTIALAAVFLAGTPAGNLEKSCAAVTLGQLAADVLSLGLMLLAYVLDRRRHYESKPEELRLTARMLRIALPLALAAYARSALTTLQHLMVPRGLKSSGLSADRALSGYGVIQGMAMPVIYFPACMVAALADLMVPELTAAQVKGDAAGIRHAAGELLRMTLLFSLAAALFLLLTAEAVGMLLYGNREAVDAIRLLAPLIPVIYTDMSVDGCLRGLGQQVWSMGINIFDALIGLILVQLLLPKYALRAYLGILYLTELVNLALSVGRLKAVIPPAA